MSQMLLKVQVGPVQEFIAQARSTRDMWAGSYLLSWLTASAMKVFKEADGVEFIFPTLEDQPLYGLFNGDLRDVEKGLIPTLPNVFMLLVEEDQAVALAAEAKDALKNELKNIGDSCWKKMIQMGASEDRKTRWDEQLEEFPIVNWHAVPLSSGWKNDVDRLGKEMAARRNTREFSQWNGVAGASKDVLSGKEEIIGDENFWKDKQEKWHGAGPFGAMNCIKRLFPEAYLEKVVKQKSKLWDKNEGLGMYNTRDIAARNREGFKGIDSNKEPKPVNPYIAVLAMDGDKMGAALKELGSKKEHTEFSETLATFAEQQVGQLVKKVGGQLVYAGGDDVMAMCPADAALDLAKTLADTFRKIMGEYKLDSSCGIAVGHYMFPLQRIVHEAREAEKRGKNDRGRAAFAMTLLKRSGEIVHWGGKWNSAALDLYRLYTDMASRDEASCRFPYALAELLAPYRLSCPGESSVPLEQLKEIVKKEYLHVRSRQKLIGAPEEQKKMDELAEFYVDEVFKEQEQKGKSGGIPADFPNLFLASAFMNRQRGEN